MLEAQGRLGYCPGCNKDRMILRVRTGNAKRSWVCSACWKRFPSPQAAPQRGTLDDRIYCECCRRERDSYVVVKNRGRYRVCWECGVEYSTSSK